MEILAGEMKVLLESPVVKRASQEEKDIHKYEQRVEVQNRKQQEIPGRLGILPDKAVWSLDAVALLVRKSILTSSQWLFASTLTRINAIFFRLAL